MSKRAWDTWGCLLAAFLALMVGATALGSLTVGATALGPPFHPTESHIPPPGSPPPGGGGGGATGVISGRVFIDANGNGVPDLGEIAYAGVAVTLDNGGSVVVTTFSDGNGVYGFNALSDATWSLTISPPPGYSASPPAVGGLVIAGGNQLFVDFALSQGQIQPTVPPTLPPVTRPAGVTSAPAASAVPSASETLSATATLLATETATATPLPPPTAFDIEATIRAAVQATVVIAQSLQTGVAAVTASAAAPATGTAPAATPTGAPSGDNGSFAGGLSANLIIGSWVLFGAVSLVSLGVALGAVRVADLAMRNHRPGN